MADTVIYGQLILRTDNRNQLAADCVIHRIYTPGGYMRNEYVGIRDDDKRCTHRRLMVLYYKNLPIAAIIGAKNCIMVYVCPHMRRSGFGTLLIGAYVRKYRLKRSDLRAVQGARGSGQLYFSNRVMKAESDALFYKTFGYHCVIRTKV